MKILFFILKLENIAGGAERVLCDLANNLCDEGHQISVVSLDHPDAKPFYRFRKNITHIKVGTNSKSNFFRISEIIGQLIKLRKITISRQATVAIGFMHTAYVPLSIALIGSKIPVIASEHIVRKHYNNRPFQFLSIVLSSFLINKITVISKKIRNGYPWIINRKMIVIPNLVNIPGCKNIISERNKKNVILSIGRLEKQKDHKTLISAYAVIKEKHPEWTVRIIGEGKLKNMLEKHALNLGVADKVTFLPNTEYLEKEYKESKIFVLPSRYEALGLVILEAMSFFLPVIAFKDCEGANKIIENNKNGVLVNPNNSRIDNLAKTLSLLIKDNYKRISFGKEGKKYSSSYKKKQNAFIKWQELLLKVELNEKKK